jgi:hypothetical protein
MNECRGVDPSKTVSLAIAIFRSHLDNELRRDETRGSLSMKTAGGASFNDRKQWRQ